MFENFICERSYSLVKTIPGLQQLETLREFIKSEPQWVKKPWGFPSEPVFYECEPIKFNGGWLAKAVGENDEVYSYEFIVYGNYKMSITCDYIDMAIDCEFVKVWSKDIGSTFGLTFHPGFHYRNIYCASMTVDEHGQRTYTSERVGDEFRSDARVAHDAADAAGAY